MKKKIEHQVKKATRREVVASAAESSYLHNDSRVIIRRRDVLQYELAAVEEHLNGLRASLTAVMAQKERLEATIDGLTRALARR